MRMMRRFRGAGILPAVFLFANDNQNPPARCRGHKYHLE